MTLDPDSDDLIVDSDEEHALDDLCFFEQSQHVMLVEWLWSFTENDKTTCVIWNMQFSFRLFLFAFFRHSLISLPPFFLYWVDEKKPKQNKNNKKNKQKTRY